MLNNAMWNQLFRTEQKPERSLSLSRSEICAKARKARAKSMQRIFENDQQFVLRAVILARHTGITVQQLMEAMNVSKTTAAKHLKALHKRGHCYRRKGRWGEFVYFYYKIACNHE